MKSVIKKVLIKEGRVDTAKKKYVAPNYIFDMFIKSDPSGNHKYLDWMLKQFLSTKWPNTSQSYISYWPNQYEEDYIREYSPDRDLITNANMVIHIIEQFHKNVQRLTQKDINQYKYKDLRKAINSLEPSKGMIKSQAEVVYEDNRWLMLIPKTHAASCQYGAGTKWCTTERDNPKYFNEYTDSGTLFYVIKKGGKKENLMYKFAIYVKDNWKDYGHDLDDLEIYDSKDNGVEPEHLIGVLPDAMLQIIKNKTLKPKKRRKQDMLVRLDHVMNRRSDITEDVVTFVNAKVYDNKVAEEAMGGVLVTRGPDWDLSGDNQDEDEWSKFGVILGKPKIKRHDNHLSPQMFVTVRWLDKWHKATNDDKIYRVGPEVFDLKYYKGDWEIPERNVGENITAQNAKVGVKVTPGPNWSSDFYGDRGADHGVIVDIIKEVTKKGNWFRNPEYEYLAQVEWRTEDGTPIRRRKYKLSGGYEGTLSVLNN